MTRLLDPATLRIVTYPHSTLRRVSKPLKRVDAELQSVVRRMFELMYASSGVGLAANQVDLPFRLFVLNLKANPDEGQEMVFINPVISRPKGTEEAEEGCLSLPDLHALVTRPKRVHVQAFTLAGQKVDADLDGMLARVIQHETDHLDGIVFPDRMTDMARQSVEVDLDVFETDFRSRAKMGEIPDDEEIEARLQQWEERYC